MNVDAVALYQDVLEGNIDLEEFEANYKGDIDLAYEAGESDGHNDGYDLGYDAGFQDGWDAKADEVDED